MTVVELHCVHPDSKSAMARFGAGREYHARGSRRARAARNRAIGPRDEIGGTCGGQRSKVGAW
jgi:hypothetical protein